MNGILTRWLLLLMFCGAIVLGHVRRSVAQDLLPLLMEVDASSFNSRTCGPIPLVVNMQWEGESLLEGSLELHFRDYLGTHLGTHVVDDFFVSPGQQQMALLIPSLRQAADEQVDIYATLTTPTKKWQVKPMMVRVPGLIKRTLAVSIGFPKLDITDPEDTARDIVNWLKIESLQPDLTVALGGMNKTPAQSLFTLSAVEEFPADPHWHCASDIVVLMPEALAKIDQTRMDSLIAWVRAGGSLCVFAGDQRHSPQVIDRLNSLIGEKNTALRLLTDSNAAILWEAVDTDYSIPRTMHCGLGRLLICRMDFNSEPDLNTSEWRRAAGFLWKLRDDQLAVVHRQGAWDVTLAQRIAANTSDDYQHFGMSGQAFNVPIDYVTDFSPRPIGGGAGLIENLSPHGMQIVPLWLIGLTGLLYVLAVGPLDYWLLGRLRLRKYTWVLFPAVTVIFLAGTVLASSLFIRGNDDPGVATFKDIIDGGLVARQNELQLLFTGGSRTIRTEANRCMFSTLSARDFGTRVYRGYDTHTNDIVPTVLHGRMPTQITAVQAVPQWTPQLNRLCKIHRVPLADDSGFDWDAPVDVTTSTGRLSLRQRVAATFGPEAIVHAYTNNGRVKKTDNLDAAIITGATDGTVKLRIAGDQNVFRYSGEDANYGFKAALPGGLGFIMNRDFLDQLSVREQPGLFSVISQASPMGGYRFEDMSLLDPSDKTSTLLVIAIRQNGAFTIYRRLYR